MTRQSRSGSVLQLKAESVHPKNSFHCFRTYSSPGIVRFVGARVFKLVELSVIEPEPDSEVVEIREKMHLTDHLPITNKKVERSPHVHDPVKEI